MKKNNNVGKMVAIGAGVAALAAAGYFFFGPNGEKNRKKMKGWMIKMKGEVVEKMEMVKDMTEPAYNNIVDSVAASYIKAGQAKEEVVGLAKDLKKHWKAISGMTSGKKKTATKKKAPVKAKKVVKKGKK